MKTLPKIAAVLAATCGLAFSGQASAYVYADAQLDLSNLQVNLTGFTSGTATTYTFTVTNQATLTGSAPVITTNTCSGNFSTSTSTCNSTGGTTPVLTATPANLGSVSLATPTNTANTLTPTAAGGTGEYSNAGSVIKTAELVTANPTSTESLAQSQVTGNDSASANATINSQTQLTETFAVQGNGSLTVSFTALLQLLAQADQALFSDNASGNFTIVLNQTQNATGGAVTGNSATWSGGSTCSFGATSSLSCSITNPFDLNQQVALGGPGSTAFNQSGDFSVTFNGLSSGLWTLSLTTQANTNVQAFTPAPEPEVLLLLASGLLGAGLRYRKDIANKLAA